MESHAEHRREVFGDHHRGDAVDDLLRRRRPRGGTRPTGEQHGNSKLTREDVHRIRAIYNLDETSQAGIAEDFGISQTTVSKIVRGETWGHV